MDEGHFTAGKKTGTWKTYDETGAVKKERNFK